MANTIKNQEAILSKLQIKALNAYVTFQTAELEHA